MRTIVPDPATGLEVLGQVDCAARKLLQYKGRPGVDHGKHNTIILRDHALSRPPMWRRVLPFLRGSHNVISGLLHTGPGGRIEWMKFYQRGANSEKSIAMRWQGQEVWVEMLERQRDARWHVAFRHNVVTGRFEPLDEHYLMLAS